MWQIKKPWTLNLEPYEFESQLKDLSQSHLSLSRYANHALHFLL